MIRAVLVHDESRIAEVVAALLRGLGLDVSPVYTWNECEQAKLKAAESQGLVIVPVAADAGRLGRWR